MFSLFDWDKDFYRFSSSTGYKQPYKIKYEEDKITLVHNALGVNKKDVDIKLVSENSRVYLVITGETKVEVIDSTYSIDSRFEVNADKIKNIEYEVKDGLVYIEIFYKEPEKVRIDIKEKR